MAKPTLPRRKPLALLVAAARELCRLGAGAEQPRGRSAHSRRGATARRRTAARRPTSRRSSTIGRLRSTALDVIGARLEEDVVSDFLGAEAISRVGDSTVSLALRRVPGLTLVNDQFIYVRGLGERYSSVQLNGAQVPSPDLTRNVIPLDIFPTEIIDALAGAEGLLARSTGGVRRRQRQHHDAQHSERPHLQRRDRLGLELRRQRRRLTRIGRPATTASAGRRHARVPRRAAARAPDLSRQHQPDEHPDGPERDGNFHFISRGAKPINRDLALSLNRDVEIDSKELEPRRQPRGRARQPLVPRRGRRVAVRRARPALVRQRLAQPRARRARRRRSR